MKTFKKWLKEDGPTNSSSMAIRGLGNVTGSSDSIGITDPSVTGYALDNIQTQAAIQATVQQMMNAHVAGMTTDGDDGNTVDGGDQPQNTIGYKPGMRGGGTANYTGKGGKK
jgi:hypothetical protein